MRLVHAAQAPLRCLNAPTAEAVHSATTAHSAERVLSEGSLIKRAQPLVTSVPLGDTLLMDTPVIIARPVHTRPLLVPLTAVIAQSDGTAPMAAHVPSVRREDMPMARTYPRVHSVRLDDTVPTVAPVLSVRVVQSRTQLV